MKPHHTFYQMNTVIFGESNTFQLRIIEKAKPLVSTQQ